MERRESYLDAVRAFSEHVNVDKLVEMQRGHVVPLNQTFVHSGVCKSREIPKLPERVSNQRYAFVIPWILRILGKAGADAGKIRGSQKLPFQPFQSQVSPDQVFVQFRRQLSLLYCNNFMVEQANRKE